MNQSEFAALHDVSRKTVTKWKERGWLVFAGDEIDVDASNANLKRYRRDGAPAVTQSVTQPAKGNKRKTVTQAASEVTLAPGESADDAAGRILTGAVELLDFDEARCFKENYLGLKAQLEYDRDSGLVVDVTEVAKAVGAEYAKVRTRLLSIPAEQAPRLHRCKTPAELQDILQEIITEALEELTRDGAGNPT
jgi:phage terminase Nu1 subunit (DNA packaging protein)